MEVGKIELAKSDIRNNIRTHINLKNRELCENTYSGVDSLQLIMFLKSLYSKSGFIIKGFVLHLPYGSDISGAFTKTMKVFKFSYDGEKSYKLKVSSNTTICDFCEALLKVQKEQRTYQKGNSSFSRQQSEEITEHFMGVLRGFIATNTPIKIRDVSKVGNLHVPPSKVALKNVPYKTPPPITIKNSFDQKYNIYCKVIFDTKSNLYTLEINQDDFPIEIPINLSEIDVFDTIVETRLQIFDFVEKAQVQEIVKIMLLTIKYT